MRAIVVDDLRTLAFPDGYKVIHCRSVDDAAYQLSLDRTDVLVLDHDLGSIGDVKGLIKFIEYMHFIGQPLEIGIVYIVSSNPSAHNEFPQALRRLGYEVGLGIGPATIDNQKTATRGEIARLVELASNPYA